MTATSSGTNSVSRTIWPKTLPVLSEAQKAIREEFMAQWHKDLPSKYRLIEHFNHTFPVRVVDKPAHGKIETLEVGAGIGGHIPFEDLSFQNYTAMELREEMAEIIRQRYPQVKTIVGNCEVKIGAPDKTFDRIVAVHVLEHLPNLPAAINEILRVLKDDGQFTIVIPCEGGLAYTLAREVSAKRMFVKKYKMDYEWFVKSEHVSTADEIIAELNRHFHFGKRSFFPLKVPIYSANLCVGIDMRKKLVR